MGFHSQVKYYQVRLSPGTVVDFSHCLSHFNGITQNISDTYIRKWQIYGLSRDGTHAKLAYDWYGSWTTLYSLFADAALCFHPQPSLSNSTILEAEHTHYTQAAQIPIQPYATNSTTPHNFIPHSVYVNQSLWYALSMQRYGLPLDSRHLYSKSDWMLEAAAVASPDVRKQVVHSIARWLNETESDLPFTDLFETEGKGGFGAGNRFAARPVVGAHFSLVALARMCAGRWKLAEWEQ